MSILAISCVTTSNLPWFMDLTFQVPKKYFSLQHWTLLPSPVTSSTAFFFFFCFGSVSSFFYAIANVYIKILCYMSWKAFVIWWPIFPGISAKFLVSLPYIPFHLDMFLFIMFLREIYLSVVWRLQSKFRVLCSVSVFQILIYLPKRCCESAALNMPANLENSAVATGLEKVSFHSNPKERQCQRMLKLPHSCTHLTG